MKKFKVVFDKIWAIQRKYQIITYLGLIYLTLTTHFLREDKNDLTKKVVKLETVNQNLISNMVIYNRNFEEFPLPIWQKVKRNGKFILQYINPEYEKRYGHVFNNDRLSIIGKNNFELGYSKETAQKYYENDVTVSITGTPLIKIEYIPDEDGNQVKIKVIKWRVIRGDDVLVYGMVIETEVDGEFK